MIGSQPISVDACRVCQLAEYNDDIGKMKGNGAIPARFMVIAQNPSIRRDGQRSPYAPVDVSMIGTLARIADTDSAPAALARVLTEVGWPVGQTYFTNELKCSTPANREPLRDEWKMCRTMWLDDEIRQCDPLLIVCLGNATFNRVSEHYGQRIIVTKVFHHSYIAKRRPDLYGIWLKQWVRILESIR